MVDCVQVGGFWISAREAHRFADARQHEGILDLDVRKTDVCLEHCKRFDLALDIGAHYGAVSCLLSRRFKRVVAFEPVPDTYEILLRNVEVLSNVEPKPYALGAEEAQLYFETAITHSQLSRVILPNESPAFGAKSARVGPVEAKRLDSLGLKDVSFIKIDVEGFELDVIEGGLDTILASRPLIQIEQGGNEAKFHGRPLHEASAKLEALGMTRVEGLPFKDDRLFCFLD